MHANLGDTDTKDYHLEWHWQKTCSTENCQRFKELSNVFGIADDILVVGYKADDKDYDKTLKRLLQICRQVNRCTSVPFFGEVISLHGAKPDP